MIRLSVRVAREHAELALAELLALDPRGVEERELDDGSVEYSLYGAPGEVPSLPDVRAAVGPAFVDIATEEVADDWAERWTEFHRPVTISDRAGRARLRIRPPWAPSGPAGIPDVVIDPGQAFGTGAHASTRLSLELLLDTLAPADRPPGPLCDVGCGSGVLAIAAARLGFAPVVAVDHDPECLRATRENAARNGLALDVHRVDIREGPPPPAPTVVANLLRPLLVDLARALRATRAAPDRLIASGLLVEEADEVAGAFSECLGLRELRRVADAGWAALLLAPDAVPILERG